MGAEVLQKELGYRQRRSFKFLFLSLVLHGLFVAAISREWAHKNTNPLASNALPVDVEIIPLNKKDFDKITSQIVETTKVQKADTPAKDAYLGEQTQVVHEQTRAKTSAPFNEAKNTRAAGDKSDKIAQQPKLGDMGVRMNFKPLGNVGPGETASTSDYLKDVKNGSQTLLNTREFAYFSFYQRVRKQLEQHWEPGLRKRLRSMTERGRHLAADNELSTKVMVVLNTHGLITKVLVEDTSGLLDLDQAAIDAFNRAGPFPNPPKGMVDADGTVKVQWEFVLKT